MKKTTKIFSGVAIVAVIAVAALVFGNSGVFTGRLGPVLPSLVKPTKAVPLMLVLFSEDQGYPIQISGDGFGIEAAIRVINCATNETGKKWCEFEFSDTPKNAPRRNDQRVRLVEDRDTFTMYGSNGYNYVVRAVDITDLPENTGNERAVIELSKVAQ